MAYHTGILEALQDYGLVLGHNLFPYAGWETRGSSVFNPRGSTNHHTAGSINGILPSLWVLLNGRPDVPGPLCNGALDRLARIHLIAAGRANHAGRGGYAGLVGNSSVWGLEVEHTGSVNEPVHDEQWDMMHRWHAGCSDYSGFTVGMVHQHFEWTTRKIDFVKPITDPYLFRSDVADVLRNKGDSSMSAEDVAALKAHIDSGLAALGRHVSKEAEDHDDPGFYRIVDEDWQEGWPIYHTDFLTTIHPVSRDSGLDEFIRATKRMGGEKDVALRMKPEFIDELFLVINEATRNKDHLNGGTVPVPE